MGTKITNLTQLVTSAATDVIPIVDVSDPTQAPSGTTKYIERDDLPFLKSGDNVSALANDAGYKTVSDFANNGEAAGANRDLGNTDAFGLSFITDGVGRINILPTGEVGIGTSLPTEKLDVVGNVQLDGFLYVNKNNGGVNLGGNTAFSKQLVMQSDWTYNHGNVTIKNNGIDVDFRNVSNGQFTWRNGGAISMVYDSSERLGIGTATPTEKLHINGRQFISNQSAPSTPTGGGIVYVEAGALKYIGSSGTITTLGIA